MVIKMTIDRFEGKTAVLKTEKGESVEWPKNNLPEVKEGAVLIFDIKNSDEYEREEKEKAKKILNEILNPKD